MASVDTRIEEEAAAIAELESRVEEQIAALRKTPSIAGEAALSALQCSLELGRKHLQFEREKLKSNQASSDIHLPVVHKTKEISSQENFTSSFQFEAKQRVSKIQARIAKQIGLIESFSKQGREHELIEEHRKLSNLRKMFDLSNEILFLERELVSDIGEYQHEIPELEQLSTASSKDERFIEIEGVNVLVGQNEETTDLEKYALHFARDEQKKGFPPLDILKKIKYQSYPLDLYNSEIERVGYSFGLRLPRGSYLLYRDRHSEWSIGREKPDWLQEQNV